MSRILIVRHAQASFLSADYDRLSAVGETQARRLGEYWSQQKVMFDRVYSGPCVRQSDTAKIVAAVYGTAELRFPEPVSVQEFDEYAGEAVLRKTLPELIGRDQAIRDLHEAFLRSKDACEQRRAFQKLFEIVIGRWVDGELAAPGVESWSDFCARVNYGLARVASEAASNEQIAIFSSGGPIGAAMQRALNLSPRNTLRASWMSQNCSYSEFLFSADRFTLSAFNAFPHLDDAELLTYR